MKKFAANKNVGNFFSNQENYSTQILKNIVSWFVIMKN